MNVRRHFLRTLGAGAWLAAPAWLLQPLAHAAKAYAVTHTDSEWKARLTPAQFAVLRRAGTERPFSSPLNHEKRAGVFA
jgi:peptide-methionine (R)-S-oxide reductase